MKANITAQLEAANEHIKSLEAKLERLRGKLHCVKDKNAMLMLLQVHLKELAGVPKPDYTATPHRPLSTLSHHHTLQTLSCQPNVPECFDSIPTLRPNETVKMVVTSPKALGHPLGVYQEWERHQPWPVLVEEVVIGQEVEAPERMYFPRVLHGIKVLGS